MTERSIIIDMMILSRPEMELGAGIPKSSALELLDELTLEGIFAPHDIRDRSAALACLAGLRLLINDVDGAHKIAQDLTTPEGSYWHAIVHRRDGDYWNAKYWIRKVGIHPVYLELGRTIKPLANAFADAPRWMHEGRWDAYGFVDLVEKTTNEHREMMELCRRVQQAECEALFEFCYQEGCEPFE